VGCRGRGLNGPRLSAHSFVSLLCKKRTSKKLKALAHYWADAS